MADGSAQDTTPTPNPGEATGNTGGDGSTLGDVGDGQQTSQSSDGNTTAPEEGGSKDGKPTSSAEVEISIPEGLVADEKVLGEFKALAKEVGMSSEAASKMVEWQLRREQAYLQELDAEQVQQKEAWVKELKGDKEFGGDKYEHTLHDAKAALLKFGGADAATVFREFGLAEHPTLIKMFANIGQAIKEDNSATDGAPTGGEPSRQQVLASMYPSMFDGKGGEAAT